MWFSQQLPSATFHTEIVIPQGEKYLNSKNLILGSNLGNRAWVVIRDKVKKLYELSQFLTALGLANLVVSEAEISICSSLELPLFLLVVHRENAD